MSATIRDLWQYLRPVVETKKNNKNIVLPAFSAPCGPTNNCLFANGAFDWYQPLVPVNFSSSGLATFTIECLIKPGKDADTRKQTIAACNYTDSQHPDNMIVLELYLQYTTIYLAVLVNGTIQTVSSSLGINTREWSHIAATFDGQTFSIYVNGDQSSADIIVIGGGGLLGEGRGEQILGEGDSKSILGESGLVSGPGVADITTFGFTALSLCGNNWEVGNAPYYGWIDEFRFWSVCKSRSEIVSKMHRIIQPALYGGEIMLYYNFNEAANTTSIEDEVDGYVLALNGARFPGSHQIVDDEKSPVGFGASFIAYKQVCVSDSPLSLRFPVGRPVDADHALCVSWFVDDVLYRYKLYGNVGEIINPDPVMYRGEAIPAGTFDLEFWNIDGNDTINLVEDKTIITSHTSQPTTGVDHSSATDLTPAGTSALAAPFPWVFPISFNQQQTY